MLGAARYALSIFLLAILFLIVSSHTGTAANGAIVPANAPANPGAGSGVDQPFSPSFAAEEHVDRQDDAEERCHEEGDGR